MGSIILLLLILNYVFAVMATKMFSADFQEHFGTIGASFFTFFQIMTLEGWSGEIVRPVMEKYPWAWVLFVPYIVLATFMGGLGFGSLLASRASPSAPLRRYALIELALGVLGLVTLATMSAIGV